MDTTYKVKNTQKLNYEKMLLFLKELSVFSINTN
jgi:hypothetical protein